jgi:dTDP-4-amino-4,6-dideoxygalactose transaminase
LEQLTPLQDAGLVRLPQSRPECRHNAHLFYMLVSTSLQDRDKLLAFLKSKNINAVFHFVPLHTSPMGLRMGYKEGDLPNTEELSLRLIRLPCYFELTREDQDRVVNEIYIFFGHSREYPG